MGEKLNKTKPFGRRYRKWPNKITYFITYSPKHTTNNERSLTLTWWETRQTEDELLLTSMTHSRMWKPKSHSCNFQVIWSVCLSYSCDTVLHQDYYTNHWPRGENEWLHSLFINTILSVYYGYSWSPGNSPLCVWCHFDKLTVWIWLNLHH